MRVCCFNTCTFLTKKIDIYLATGHSRFYGMKNKRYKTSEQNILRHKGKWTINALIKTVNSSGCIYGSAQNNGRDLLAFNMDWFYLPSASVF